MSEAISFLRIWFTKSLSTKKLPKGSLGMGTYKNPKIRATAFFAVAQRRSRFCALRLWFLIQKGLLRIPPGNEVISTLQPYAANLAPFADRTSMTSIHPGALLRISA